MLWRNDRKYRISVLFILQPISSYLDVAAYLLEHLLSYFHSEPLFCVRCLNTLRSFDCVFIQSSVYTCDSDVERCDETVSQVFSTLGNNATKDSRNIISGFGSETFMAFQIVF